MRILAESLEPGVKVAEVARRNDVAAAMDLLEANDAEAGDAR